MQNESEGILSAAVFLRTASGKHLLALETDPSPEDPDGSPAPSDAVDAVAQTFARRGFDVIPDPALAIVVIAAPARTFASCFGVSEAALQCDQVEPSVELIPPQDLIEFIEHITFRQCSALQTTEGPQEIQPSSHQDLVGSVVGRFRITERLGAGGMGEVYRAIDMELKRTVAIKRLTPRPHDEWLSSRNLLREARRSSALNHPCIASVYDVFSRGNESFLVMEYVEGSTLRQRLKSPVTLTEFCAIAIQCTEALAAAHQKGIVHGDIKPANIMLTADRGDVKVCDFGVARRLPEAVSPTDTTTSVLLGGTPAYMAPEVADLEKTTDARADIFSLGVVFYEMVAGRNPFQGDSGFATLDRIRSLSPEPLDRVNRQVPPALTRLVQRMLEKLPANRYSSAAEIRDELSTISADLASADAMRKRWRTALTGLAIAGVVALAVIAGLQFRERQAASSSSTLPPTVNLAVLPFSSTGGDAAKQFFAQGLTEVVNRRLATLTVNRKFQVATEADRRLYKVTDWSGARQLLGANTVLTGTLKYVGTGVKIECLVIDTRSGRTLRSETVTDDGFNPIALEDGVVQAMVRMIGLNLKPEERAVLGGHRTQQPGAYDFYLQGRGYLLNFDRVESLDSAISVFRRALEIDHSYALAYAGLGEAYWLKKQLTGKTIWVEPARAACEGALGLDPNAAEPHTCLGMVLNGTGDYEKAAAEFTTALDIEPTNDQSYVGLATAYEKLGRNTDAERTYQSAIHLRPNYWGSYNTLGGYYYRLGRLDDAAEMFHQVVALAPDNYRAYSSLGAVSFQQNRISDAIEFLQKSIEIKPNYIAASNLGTLYYFQGDYQRAIKSYRQALVLDRGDYKVWKNFASALEWAGDTQEATTAFRRARDLIEDQLVVNPRDPSLHVALATAQAFLGDKVKAKASLDEAIRLSPTNGRTLFDIAGILEQYFGERDEALKWLQKAVEHGQSWPEIDRSPTLQKLRRDPRYERIRPSK
jgi:serine/threonine-protein kinase